MTKFSSTVGVLLLSQVVAAFSLSPALADIATGTEKSRPKIGLALSGGGARGAAHVGVLRVLEEMHIPIDYIAGTSMGSIIGGLYASGMTPEQIETALTTINWEHIFSDAPPRADRSFRRKRDDDLHLIAARPGISDKGELKFPTGAIQGQKFDLALRQLTMPVHGATDFDRLYIPFRAVASDIGSGKPVVIKSGDLATAMRASMAVPGAFGATNIDGRLLVDGGITNNLPIDVVRDMGADIVIAVDISSPYAPADTINNLFSITLQLTAILTRTNADQQVASLTGRDVLIVPNLGDISSSDFMRAAEAMPLGREAAEAQREKLANLTLTDSAYRDYLQTHANRPGNDVPIIHFVRIKNDSTVGDGMIRDRLYQRLDEPLNRLQLEEDISNIYGLELFQTVGYDVIEEDGKTGLLVDARARSWGPNYLQIGLELSSDADGQSYFNVSGTYHRTGINALGGELRAGLEVGATPHIVGEWYQPLDTLSRYFVNTRFRYGEDNFGYYSSGEDRLADFRVNSTLLDLAVGREIGVYGETRLGYSYHTGKVELATGTPGWPEFHFDTAEVYGQLSMDRIDNLYFPERGHIAVLRISRASTDIGSDAAFDQFTLRGAKFTTFGDGNAIGLGGGLKTTLDGTPGVQDQFRLGGFLNLSGYPEDSLVGQQSAVLAAVYYRRFRPMPFLSWYIGGSLEYGGVWADKNDIGTDGIASGSLFLGSDTPLGPIYLGVGKAEGGHNAAFLYLGRPLFR